LKILRICRIRLRILNKNIKQNRTFNSHFMNRDDSPGQNNPAVRDDASTSASASAPSTSTLDVKSSESKSTTKSNPYKTKWYGLVRSAVHPLYEYTKNGFWYKEQTFRCAYDGHLFTGIPVIVDIQRVKQASSSFSAHASGGSNAQVPVTHVLGIAVCCSLSCKEAMKYNLFPHIVPHNVKTQSTLVNAELYGVTTPVSLPRPFTHIDTFCTDASIACTLTEFRSRLVYPKHPPPESVKVESVKWKYIVEHCPFVKPSHSPEEMTEDSPAKTSHIHRYTESVTSAPVATSSSQRMRTPLEQHFTMSNDVVNMDMADKPVILADLSNR
jgi:hypothetical protein